MSVFAFLLVAVVILIIGIKIFAPNVKFIKGNRIVTSRRKMSLAEPTAENRYLWGNEFLPFAEARKHFLTVGSTGSGKTINILLLLKSVVAQIEKEDSNLRG